MSFHTQIIIKDNHVIKSYNKNCREFQIEARILSTVNHPHIISALHVLSNPASIVMPKLDQTLSDWLEYGNTFVEKKMLYQTKINYLGQIASGLEYLHLNNILHLDLKLDNIMISNHQIKLIDFGLAEYVDNGTVITTQIKCTVTHRPPEGFGQGNSSVELGFGFDIWSFGIIMYELLFGIPIYLQSIIPSYELDSDYLLYEQEVYLTITSDSFKFALGRILPSYFMQCINFNPEKRPLISNITKNLFLLHKEL